MSCKATREGVFWIEQMLPKPEVIQILSHATVFACPSIYEPLGIVNLEAMACEAAVVATATGGIVEVVVDGETGFLVPIEPGDDGTGAPRDPAQVRGRLRRAREHADRRPGAGQGDRPRGARAGGGLVRLAGDRRADVPALPQPHARGRGIVSATRRETTTAM